MHDIPEYYINGVGDQKIIEINHFIIQTVRIPLTEKANIKKIIQIALNIGQFQGRKNKSLEKYIKSRNKLTDYLSKKEIIRISNKIPEYIIINLNNLLKIK